MDTQDLLNQPNFFEGDEQAEAVFDVTGKTFVRAAVGVMRPQAMAFDLGPQHRMGAPHTQFSTDAPRLQSKGTPAQTINYQMAPQKKPGVEIGETMKLPAVLDMMMQFEDDADQEMFMEEEPEDGTLQRLEQDEYGCKTSLVSSRNPEDVRASVRTAIAILESSQPREISHQNEGWQLRCEYIYNNDHASINIRMLEIPESKEVAIQFSRAHGSGVVFQHFYRLCTMELKNHLDDVHGLNKNAMPEPLKDTFDRSGIVVDGKTVQNALANHLRLMGSTHNRTIEPQREVTSAIVQIVQRHTAICLDFAAQDATLCFALTQLMNDCGGDLEVMRNCVRILNLLIESGPDCTMLYAKLHKAKQAAFTIVAQCVANWVKNAEPAAIATMVCGDLCHFLGLLLKNYYNKASVKAPEEGVAALFAVSELSAPERYANIQTQCTSLAHKYAVC
jgi:hypothetical protein